MPPSDPAAVPPPEDEIRRTLSGPEWDASRERAASESAAYFTANPPDDQAVLDALFADAPDARDSAAWRDESPLPQWAVERADEWLRRSDEDPLLTLASLLASVREGALREAAVEGATAATEGRSVSIAIHALIHTPPSGGGA